MRLFVLCLAAVLVPGGSGCAGSPPSPAEVPAAAPSAPPPPSQQVAPGEYLVTVAPGADPGAVQQVYGPLGLRKLRVLGGGIVLVVPEKDPGLERMKELQAADARLQAVQPNFVYRALQ